MFDRHVSSHLMRAFLALVALLVPVAALAQSSPSDFTSATRYDAARRVVGTIAPDPDGTGPLHYAATRTTYDLAGNATRVEKGELAAWQSESIAPASWSGFTVQSQVDTTYDAMGRKLTETVSSGGTPYGVTQYSYNDQGLAECTAQRLNPAAWGSLPASACTAGTSGAYGPDRITKTVYDAAGQPLRTIKAYGTPLQQDYVTTTYSPNGKPLSVKDANGNKAAYTYDGFDRLVTWAFPSKTATGSVSTTDYESYGYDANGNRTSLRKRDGRVLTYTFDALNRVTLKVVPDACVSGFACTTPPANAVRDVYYGYDLVGLQLYARFDSASGSDGVVASYDGFGREASETVTMGAASRTVGYQYDADGNRTRITWPDAAYVTYSYDGLDRMTGVLLGGGATLATMSYDAGGQQAGETRGSVATAFGYDAIGRLSSLADDLAGTSADLTSSYAYSPASQLVSRTRSNTGYAWTGYVTVSRAYAVNGLNQYTSAGSATFGYDANGNLASDGTASYTFDAENRLVADAATTLDYDPMGRLAKVANAATTETYLYAGDQRIAEYDASGTMTARYVPGAGGDNPLIQYTGSATTAPQALQGDERGSIVSVADASGAPVAINSYDEYGIPAVGNVGRYGYTGQMWVPQLGLWYYKARFYSPTLARFLQTDPIGYADQWNLYAYVGNDPMDRVDPSGLSDINLFSPESDRRISKTADEMNSWAFDIATHGGINGVIDNRDPGRVSPDQLLKRAIQAGYKRGNTTFLMSCFLGFAWSNLKGSSAFSSTSYAQQYANVSGGRVIAASGLTHWDSSRGKDTIGISSTKENGFRLFQPGEKTSVYLGDTVVIGKNGSMTFFNSVRDGTDSNKWSYTRTYSCNGSGQCTRY